MLDLRVLVDESSVEVFADGGRVVLTDLVFPEPSAAAMTLDSVGGEPIAELLTVDAMEPLASPAR